MELRELRKEDWPAVRAIYEQGIAGRNATFETEAPGWEKTGVPMVPPLVPSFTVLVAGPNVGSRRAKPGSARVRQSKPSAKTRGSENEADVRACVRAAGMRRRLGELDGV